MNDSDSFLKSKCKILKNYLCFLTNFFDDLITSCEFEFVYSGIKKNMEKTIIINENFYFDEEEQHQNQLC